MNKKFILTTLLIGALCIALPSAAKAASSSGKKDQVQLKQNLTDQSEKDQTHLKIRDQVKDQLKDGSCQTDDSQKLKQEAGAI